MLVQPIKRHYSGDATPPVISPVNAMKVVFSADDTESFARGRCDSSSLSFPLVEAKDAVSFIHNELDQLESASLEGTIFTPSSKPNGTNNGDISAIDGQCSSSTTPMPYSSSPISDSSEEKPPEFENYHHGHQNPNDFAYLGVQFEVDSVELPLKFDISDFEFSCDETLNISSNWDITLVLLDDVSRLED